MGRSVKGSALALLCTAVTVSACGAGGNSASPGAPTSSTSASTSTSAAPGPDGANVIAAAFTKTSAVKTARLALTYQLTAGTSTSASGVNERGTGSGVVDFGRKIADLTVNEPTGQSIEERLIGTVAYVKLPPQLAATSPALHGKDWVKEQLPRSSSGGSLGFGSGGTSASDPTSVLRLVSAVSTNVTKIGTASVRGTPTTHYRADVDFAKAAAKGGLSPAQISAFEKALGTNTFPVDLWIDQQGAARRLQFRFPLPKATTTSPAGQSGQITETLDLYDFGTPVSVSPPPANQVADAGALGSAPKATSSPGVHAS